MINALPVPWQVEEARWLTVIGFSVVLALAAWVGFRLLDAVLRRAIYRSVPLQILRASTYRAASFLPPLLAIEVVVYGAPDQMTGMLITRQILTVALVICMTWLLIQAVQAAGETVVALRPTNHLDNLAARRLQTQTRVITRAAISVIGLVGVAMALMTFPNIRHIGASLLASAGLAGIVAGLAARPLLGNLIAGLQIGLTQPIRLDDVVIIEGEWGTIEEITGTYVVVKIWDQRRLVVPLEWWTQHPFQNWTRQSSALTGTVFLWVDYRMPLQPLRDELNRICRHSLLWDRDVCLLQVTEAGEQAMQLRCLVSSADSSKNWDLRCEVREGLLAFVQAHYPQYLPRLRAEIQDEGLQPVLASHTG
ncbi:MAG: mechanosensitive ion channel family protein [Acidobacteriota bacterium]